MSAKEKCMARLESLCCLFNLPVPTLRFREEGEGGRYSFKYKRRNCKVVGTARRAIYVGGKSWMGNGFFPRWEPILLHEFAHYLTHSRAEFRPHRTGGHGPAFHRALTDVTTEWYGDASAYPWASEYKRLAAAGPRKPLD